MNQPSSVAPRPWLASYAPDVPHELELPTGSLLDIIENSVKEFPDAVALEFFGATTTYAQLGELIDRAAEGLRGLGVTHGDPVALVLPNCPQHIAAFYAVLRLGAIVVEHNPLYTARELRHQFEDHRAKVVIAWDKVVEHIQSFPDDVAVDAIVSVDITRAMPALTRTALKLPVPRLRETRNSLTASVSGVLAWVDLVKAEPISASVAKPSIGDVAVIQYTSGTTGTPKGATLTHLNLASNAAQSKAWVPSLPRGEGCVFYAVLPMFHAYGLTLCLTFAMSMGARLVLFPKFDPDLVLKVMRKRPATVLPAVPPIYERLLSAAQEKGISLKGVQVGISGAMPLSTSLVEPWETATGGYLNEGYGLSECSPVLMVNPVSELRRVGSVGLPLPGTEARVIDPDDPTIERPLGEPGELVVRGPQVMSGYWKKPEETAAVFVADPSGGTPWFRTGDIVTIDEQGFVTIVDRIKELVITGGFNVSPSEVEEALKSHHDVVDAAVVGIPSERNGEDVVAAVVMRPGAQFDGEAVRAHVRPMLTAYKVPRRVVEVDELPKSLIGKTLRREVRDNLLR